MLLIPNRFLYWHYFFLLKQLPGKRHSLDAEDEFGDNDRPRSPSPETRGSDSAANIPLIPTHGAHRTVDVNFTPRNGRTNEFFKTKMEFKTFQNEALI